MLRISPAPTRDRPDEERFRLHGQVTGPWVEELRLACNAALANGRTERALVLDLAEVSFLDNAAVRLLQALQARGVSLINGSAFVSEQLTGVTHVDR